MKKNVIIYGIAAIFLIFYIVVLGISLDTSKASDEYRAYFLQQ